MEEDKLRATIKVQKKKYSQLEVKHELLKEECEAWKNRSGRLSKDVTKLREESNRLRMDIPTEYVLKHNPEEQCYNLFMWKYDMPILIKRVYYSYWNKNIVENYFKGLIKNLNDTTILPF